jgi:hypothetical protein
LAAVQVVLFGGIFNFSGVRKDLDSVVEHSLDRGRD